MEKISYDKLVEKFEANLPKSIDWSEGSKYRPLIEPLLKTLVDVINDAIKIDPDTGYDFEDPDSDPIAAILEIQKLLNEKL